jgi:hypothetical protein
MIEDRAELASAILPYIIGEDYVHISFVNMVVLVCPNASIRVVAASQLSGSQWGAVYLLSEGITTHEDIARLAVHVGRNASFRHGAYTVPACEGYKFRVSVQVRARRLAVFGRFIGPRSIECMVLERLRGERHLVQAMIRDGQIMTPNGTYLFEEGSTLIFFSR